MVQFRQEGWHHGQHLVVAVGARLFAAQAQPEILIRAAVSVLRVWICAFVLPEQKAALQAWQSMRAETI
ncbi:MAG: hypothetical protein A2100_02215 [Sideroxydans sp. GWF2_59_14]|nr:MAG: hypothetical protein A2100_02215 [Sideroxydans sp. GWF2_59_14]